MRTVINSTMGIIPGGRILTRVARSIPLCSRIIGGAAVNLRSGFPNLFPGAQGRVTVTAAGVVACKIGLHGAGIMSNDALNLSAGSSVSTSNNVFTAPLRQVTTDVDPVGTIDLAMALDDAVTIATSTGSFGVSRTAAAVDASFSAFTDGEVALVEFAEASVTLGQYLCPDSQGRARYYDPISDTDVIARLTDPTVITVGELRYVRVVVAPQTL